MWITLNDDVDIGQIVFVVESWQEGEAPVMLGQLDPPRTNLSHEVRINGWCGSYNNHHTTGIGPGRITRGSARYPNRAFVEMLDDDDAEVLAILEECG